jgi:hypothetical protein
MSTGAHRSTATSLQLMIAFILYEIYSVLTTTSSSLNLNIFVTPQVRHPERQLPELFRAHPYKYLNSELNSLTR